MHGVRKSSCSINGSARWEKSKNNRKGRSTIRQVQPKVKERRRGSRQGGERHGQSKRAEEVLL